VEEAVQVMEDALLVKPKDADLYLILRLWKENQPIRP
jgi:hypothetical protein